MVDGTRVMLLLIVLALVSLPSIEGDEQGLQWGVDDGFSEEYDVIERHWGEETGREIISVTVEVLPELPSQLTDWSQLPIPEVTIALENGTTLTDWSEWFPVLPSFLLPIGNWSLLTELATNSSSDWEADYDPGDEWELSVRPNDTDGDWVASCDYSQDDGTLWNYHRTRLTPVERENIEEIIVQLHYERDYASLTFIYGGYLSILVLSALTFIVGVQRMPSRRISLARVEEVEVHERVAFVIFLALFAPYLITVGSYVGISAFLWVANIGLHGIGFQITDIYRSVLTPLFTFPRFIFAYQVYRFYKRNTTLRRVMAWGGFSLFYTAAWFYFQMTSYAVMMGVYQGLWIPVPLLVPLAFLLMKTDLGPVTIDWLEQQHSQEEEDEWDREDIFLG
jgi:hypothetical protein